ncbi:MAG: response regulator transcription factor [Dokdonella sp.]|uniref:response regulator transcription factor n=1 Tax=Dokdonella sp. TaxID=2291710 RepID=UPI0025C5F241|nr:response regulator transcription factor [Dokdonella sp.]MBZ0221623.1 response regulator transcription factor [Dokdonella sp.]MCC7256711.1 response regulator transcription factor [Dokdonella sp.]
MRVLIVEDSQPLAAALARGLASQGYACDHAADGEHALAFLDTVDYELVVLDLMLPGIDGLTVLRHLRQRSDATRVLVLSARDQVNDRITALDAGADDYLTKPFVLEELLARLRALKRRPLERAEPVLRHGALELDPRARSVRSGQQQLELTPKEFALLELLLRERGRVLSRTQIFERLYDGASETSDKAVEVILSTLRAKLARCGADELIQTRRGFGYVID